MEYWCINDDFKPQWVRDLMDRKLLTHHPTPVSDCYEFHQTEVTTSPTYLYDGDGLCYCNNKIGIVYDLYFDFKKLKEEIPVVKYYCDMCGKEVFDKDDMYEVKFSKKKDNYNYISVLTKKDICEDCYNKIKEIIIKKDKD